MKLTRLLRGSIAALACSSMLSAQLAYAAGPQIAPHMQQAEPKHRMIHDVALEEAGVFRGQVVDSQGNTRAAVPVSIVREAREVARAETDASGRFAVHGLTGGIYEVYTPAGSGIYRVWSPHTAPPAAVPAAIITPHENVVRGQMNGGQALSWLANPWVLAGIVAAAIAIPLALDDDDAS